MCIRDRHKDKDFMLADYYEYLLDRKASLVNGIAVSYTHLEINHIIATNLTGSIQLIKTSLPYLRKQGGGRKMCIRDRLYIR